MVMMNKKVFSIAAISFLAIGATAAGVCVLTSGHNTESVAYKAAADSTTYSVVFGENKNVLNSSSTAGSGVSNTTTENKGTLSFVYSNISHTSESWQTFIDSNSYFYNSSIIHGLKSVSLTLSESKQVDVYYGTDPTFTKHSTKGMNATNIELDITGATYFKLKYAGSGNVNIISCTVCYTCTNS